MRGVQYLVVNEFMSSPPAISMQLNFIENKIAFLNCRFGTDVAFIKDLDSRNLEPGRNLLKGLIEIGVTL